MSINIIRLNDASKKYLKTTFFLTVNENELVLINGKNGSGKSTLIKMILGFIKPDSGEVNVNTRKIAYLPEKVNLPNHLKVLDYLLMISKLKKTNIPFDYLHKFEIPTDFTIKKLSKGNKQKVAIISAIMGKEKLLLLDEPLSGLDKKSQNILRTIIKNEKRNKTIIISTHKPTLFRKIADFEYLIC
ncbi:ATP-binding cassette domain-containing protein [Acholeplasma sp. OttesenSCG-928-E16]|nr:ATP-binding cassette domain-containing protein [Acholeplasma sp. OttesenSCG-928-E16]